jgi:hypothetical protein
LDLYTVNPQNLGEPSCDHFLIIIKQDLSSLSGVSVTNKSAIIGNVNSAAINTCTTLIGTPTVAVDTIWGTVSGSVPLSRQMDDFF